jgi:hypothetical protein
MAISDNVKTAIRKEYKYRCQYCDSDERTARHIEHIIAKSKGGSDDLDNLTLSCERCNLKKADLVLPEAYSGILLARSKQKRKKIEERLSSKRKTIRSGDDPSEFFKENYINNKKSELKVTDKFLKINTNDEHVKNFTVLYKQQSKIVHNSDGKGYIEYQTYKWNSLFGEQFHNIFKNMMYVNINILEYNFHHSDMNDEMIYTFKKVGSENLLTGIFYGVNEYVRLNLSNRLIKLIKSNTMFGFKDVLCGKELKFEEVKQEVIENPFK